MRGQDVESDFAAIAETAKGWTEVQAQSLILEVRAVVALAKGEHRSALDLARGAYQINIAPDATSIETAIRAAGAVGDADAVADAMQAAVYPGRVQAAVRREGEATLAALGGRQKEALTGFVEAVHIWQELGLDVEAAFAQLNLVTLLGDADDQARAAAEEARAVFVRVGSQPLLDRLDEAGRAAARGGASGAEALAVDAPTEVRVSGTNPD